MRWFTSVQNCTEQKCQRFQPWVNSHQTFLIGHCIQEINRYVCDWLHCSTLQEHVVNIVNSHFWCGPERKNKYALDSLPDLQLRVFFAFVWVYLAPSCTFVELRLGLANCSKLQQGWHWDSMTNIWPQCRPCIYTKIILPRLQVHHEMSFPSMQHMLQVVVHRWSQ